MIWNNFFYKKIRGFFITLFYADTSWRYYSDVYFNDLFLDKYFNEATFLQKSLLSIFPNYSLKNWNIYNPVVWDLKSFRAKNYPILDKKIEEYFYTEHKFSIKDLTKMGDFFLKSKLHKKNDFKFFFGKRFKSMVDNKRLESLYHLWIFFFFVNTRIYYKFNLDVFKTLKKDFTDFNLIFILFLRRLEFIYKFRKDFWSFDLNFVNFNDFFFFLKNLNKIGKKNFFNINSNFLETSTLPETYNVKYNVLNKVTHINKLNSTFFSKLLKFMPFDGLKIWRTEVFFNVKGVVDSIFSKSNLKKDFSINFSESSTNKYIDLTNGLNLSRSNYTFFFIRKNKIFNKGRYSRNRQTYRTGFYWCLWINIFVVYGLHYLFYRFTFVFGYLWIPFIIFFGSFLFSRMLKYNFHNYKFIIAELNAFSNWAGLIFSNLYSFFLDTFSIFVKKTKKLSNSSNLFLLNSVLNSFFKTFLYLRNFLNNYKNNLENSFYFSYVNFEKNSNKTNLDFLFFFKNYFLNFLNK